MAKKISQLTQATQVKSDDVTVIVQDGETKKLPLNTLVTKQDIENKKVAGLAKLDEIEATYENDTYTPTITVKNKSSVKTGEGDEVDYSANVMDGHAKSAILKGQTLVNLATINSISFTSAWQTKYLGEMTLKGGTQYLVVVECSIDDSELILQSRDGYAFVSHLKKGFVKGENKFIISLEDNANGVQLKTGNTFDVVVEKIRLIEYVTGLENLDIPYFTGMQSVRMPVLTTSNEDGTKTNILSTSEDVTLRGIGDVQDTLDCLTGELTERIVEIVLDGTEDWIADDGRFKLVRNDIIPNKWSNGISNYFIGNRGQLTSNADYDNYFAINGYGLFLCVRDVDLFPTPKTQINEFKTWLNERNIQGNPVILQYMSAKETIKTVDLIPSGTHPSTTPYCWKDGHIQLSSSGLLPSLEYSVVTSRAGQISQNAAMIVKNDKRIFDLEILLAGGLVNTTYQALTLQNQVETGLSKVSLSSEKEPDYLLYHMIMKLIEEKAYKLDDLAEKVSVFYLYEKLSDEQFEAIYAALYPFVEDEYDELPEEAENEVVM